MQCINLKQLDLQGPLLYTGYNKISYFETRMDMSPNSIMHSLTNRAHIHYFTIWKKFDIYRQNTECSFRLLPTKENPEVKYSIHLRLNYFTKKNVPILRKHVISEHPVPNINAFWIKTATQRNAT